MRTLQIGGATVMLGDEPDFVPPVTVPQRVTMAKAHIALRRQGRLDAVKAALAAMPGDAGEEARLQFEFEPYVHRHAPLVKAMARALAWTDADVDALFVLADSIA